MHPPTLAGPRRRTVRVLIAAAVAACALPAAASAATVDIDASNTILYRAGSGELNSLNVRTVEGGALEIKDFAGLTSRTGFCAEVTASTVRCGLGFQRLDAQLGDRNDSTSIRSPFPTFVDGGAGDENFIAGAAPTSTQVVYRGNIGFDRMNYTPATRGVRMSNDNLRNDGRAGLDADDIGADIERLIGSRLDDDIKDAGQNCCGTSLFGGLGNDTLRGSPITGHQTFFDMGPSADGADTVIPGSNLARVDYSARTRPVNVTVGFGTPNTDGEAGEGDQITYSGGAILVDGGSADDTLSSLGSVLTNQNIFLRGNGGKDELEGGFGNESFDGGPGVDLYIAGPGNDSIAAIDGESDIIGCGSGNDFASLDRIDVTSGCESNPVGVLRLAPKALRAKAGETVGVALSWSHPRDWKRLKTIALRLTDDGARVGEVTLRPRADRVSAGGAVKLVRNRSRLTRKGKTVTARLALRLDKSLAGQTLEVEVEATDRRGARQLERDAGTVRVAR